MKKILILQQHNPDTLVHIEKCLNVLNSSVAKNATYFLDPQVLLDAIEAEKKKNAATEFIIVIPNRMWLGGKGMLMLSPQNMIEQIRLRDEKCSIISYSHRPLDLHGVEMIVKPDPHHPAVMGEYVKQHPELNDSILDVVAQVPLVEKILELSCITRSLK